MKTIMYSMEVPNSPAVSGEGKPRRHPLTANEELTARFDDSVTTLYDTFHRSVEKFGTRPFLGTRAVHNGVIGEYEWVNYQDICTRAKHFADGLAVVGEKPGSNVGFCSVNRAEWLIAEQSCFMKSLVTVPLYDTLGDEAVEFICRQAEMKTIIVSGNKIQLFMKIRERVETLKTIISLDPISAEDASKATRLSINLLYFADVEKNGEKNPSAEIPPKPTDLAVICYTSGTTGLPKGVMLTHGSILAAVSGVMLLTKYDYAIGLCADDVHLSYLPLAHVFERVVVQALLAFGARIGFYQGDTLKLLEDVVALKPTVFVSVPRLFNRIYDKVMSGVKAKGGIAQMLFNHAYASKKRHLEEGRLTHWLWDSLVFGSIRAKLGGKLRCMVTGSAPISPQVLDFLRICFSCEVYEGYGQTETSAASCLTQKGDWTSGHVGIPSPCNEIKLVDIPEMSYTSNDKPYPRGEVCFRGPSCFTGYYKDEEKTREALDKDHWVHSGDVGMWDDAGRLQIIDRKKNIFKLAQGEYIAPEKIEITLTKNHYIAQAYVHGDSLRSSLVAIIVPDEPNLIAWAKENSIEGSFAELCTKKEVKELFQKEISKFGRGGSEELKGFEIPKNIFVESEMFSLGNELLTTTFKLKRHEAKKKYSQKIEALYSEIKE